MVMTAKRKRKQAPARITLLTKQPKKVKRVNFIINIYPKIIILTSIFIKKCPCFCAYFCLYYHVVKRR